MPRLLVFVLFAVLAISGGHGSFVLLAHADITATKHNLTGKTFSADESSDERRRASREVCVFCHTPGIVELAELAKSGAHPSDPKVAQWQSSLETSFTFELFDDIGRSGTTEGAAAVGSVSMACLSCHDSVQAFGVSNTQIDHPFGIPYRGGARLGGLTASQLRDMAIKSSGGAPARAGSYIREDSEFRPVRSGVINKRQIWWASTIDSGQRSKTDLPLYPRKVSGFDGSEEIPFIECTSCHDPHSTRTVFLRKSNEQSQLCMTCHVK